MDRLLTPPHRGREKSQRWDGPARPRHGQTDERPLAPALTLSIVIPARDEAAGLEQLVQELTDAFDQLQYRPARWGHPLPSYEIVIVDDGSRDETPQILQELSLRYSKLRRLRLTRSAGQSAAMFAGFQAARGTWVAVLDADLQNPPAELARLWDFLPGHDAVFGWRQQRHDSWVRRAISSLANRVRNWVLQDSIRDTGCSVRIFGRDQALRLPRFQGAHRFLGPLLQREGCRIAQVPVTHRSRTHGRSHYHFWNRSLNVLVDLVGVVWLKSRSIRYEVATESGSGRAVPFMQASGRPLESPVLSGSES